MLFRSYTGHLYSPPTSPSFHGSIILVSIFVLKLYDSILSRSPSRTHRECCYIDNNTLPSHRPIPWSCALLAGFMCFLLSCSYTTVMGSCHRVTVNSVDCCPFPLFFFFYLPSLSSRFSRQGPVGLLMVLILVIL